MKNISRPWRTSRLAGAVAALLLVFPLLTRAADPVTPPPAADARRQSLDGSWQIAQDSIPEGDDAWSKTGAFPLASSRPILVPGNINEAWPNPAPVLSRGAANRDWYQRTFTPAIPVDDHLRYYLRFGAVSQTCEVWLNGLDLGSHEGGQDPFEFDVTGFLHFGQPNSVVVRVSSPYFGGITQHVSLVAQPAVRIIDAFARPNAEAGNIELTVTLENNTTAPAVVDLAAIVGEYRPAKEVGRRQQEVTVAPGRIETKLSLAVPQPHRWDLDDPFLYTLKLTSRWTGASTADSGQDEYALRTGFRDFRISNGYFYLNGRRIFLKSTHGNWYDPIVIQGNSRSMTYLSRDFTQLKKAGFNVLRFIISAALPEQLDEADERGFLIYSEHETSWFLKDPTKFGRSLQGVARRDRNHPSLVMWGMLNETAALPVYRRARAWLPTLRSIDDTRLVMLSSGRWDKDFHTGSASNPGSWTWDVYMGGEDPVAPVATGEVPEDIGAYHNGTGDAHVYQRFPTTWNHVLAFSAVGQGTKPFLLSETGDGSAYNPYGEKRGLDQLGVSADAYSRGWINHAISGLERTWKAYGLEGTYSTVEDVVVDSSLSAAAERERTFSYVRGNPHVNGFNLTSLNDCWGTGEGFLDNFREFKPGQFTVLQAGWAPLRWCLLVNPRNVYADRPLRLRVSLANEDRLPGGNYPATLKISGAAGTVWSQQVVAHFPAGRDNPFATLVFDADVSLPADLPEGEYRLTSTLTGRENAAASEVPFTVLRRQNHPSGLGAVTLLGVEPSVRELLVNSGAGARDYVPGKGSDRETIVVGGLFHGSAAEWRALYGRVAGGAHVVFLSPRVFHSGDDPKKDKLHWLALKERGELVDELEWLYHKDAFAKPGRAFTGLRTRIMTPQYYGPVLGDTPYLARGQIPDVTDAVAIRCAADGADQFNYRDGVLVGTYRHHAGQFTVNTLNLIGNPGVPAAERLILNLVKAAQADAAPLQALPADYETELNTLGL
ncbi:MAG: hypothetical protein JWM32_218 [Verrucomicrobia bacterium]|nr:hypothetical protein [Verrucomicrobiota bacterium]